MKSIMNTPLLHMLTFAILMTADPQFLHSQDQPEVTLRDGTSVILMNDRKAPTDYYYLPLTMQLARNNGFPEISLMVYRDEHNAITGGILHVLLTWGLSAAQEAEAQAIITQQIDSAGILKGAGALTFDPTELQFNQDNIFSKGLERSCTAAIRIPTLSIHKTAASFNLSPIIARFLVDELKHIGQSDDIRIKACYRYNAFENDGFTTTVQLRGEAHTSLAIWIKALKQYNLIKNVRV